MKIYVDLDHVDITEYTQIESGEYNTNKINFIFTPEYKDLVKVAIFGSKLDTEEPKFYKIYLSDDSCYLPSEVTSASDVISIGVYAFNVENGELKLRYSPTPVKTIVYEGSFREEAENSSSPTPTEIEQIMSRIISLEELTQDLDTRVEALENKACDLDSIKEDVETLKSNVEGISGRLDTVESDIDDLEGDLANTYSKTEVDTLLGSKVDTTTYNSGQAAQDEKIAKAELILSQLPKVTGEGTNFSLSPTIEYDLEVESYKGDTIQEGTPTPDTPIPIQVVTGTQEVEVVGKNLYDNSKHNNQWVSPTGIASVSGANIQKIKCIEGDIFTLSVTFESSGGNSVGVMAFYDENDTLLNRSVVANTLEGTLTRTAPANTSYMYVGHYINTPITMQVEKTNQATTYEPYQSQTYFIHLGEEELCKIGNYQDKIYYDNGKWYKYGAIGKKLGTELTQDNLAPATQGIYLLSIGAIASPKCACYCNGLTYKGTVDESWNLKNGNYIGQLFGGYNNIYINKDYTNNQKAEALAWLRSFNFTLYYVLTTASTTEITNTTLLQDLNNIKENAMSYSGTTNISTSGNLPIIITASALKQLS